VRCGSISSLAVKVTVSIQAVAVKVTGGYFATTFIFSYYQMATTTDNNSIPVEYKFVPGSKSNYYGDRSIWYFPQPYCACCNRHLQTLKCSDRSVNCSVFYSYNRVLEQQLPYYVCLDCLPGFLDRSRAASIPI